MYKIFKQLILFATNIDDKVSKRLGNYALGYTKSEKTFIAKDVGRSDDDLNDRPDEYAKSKSSCPVSYNVGAKRYHPPVKNVATHQRKKIPPCGMYEE